MIYYILSSWMCKPCLGGVIGPRECPRRRKQPRSVVVESGWPYFAVPNECLTSALSLRSKHPPGPRREIFNWVQLTAAGSNLINMTALSLSAGLCLGCVTQLLVLSKQSYGPGAVTRFSAYISEPTQ